VTKPEAVTQACQAHNAHNAHWCAVLDILQEPAEHEQPLLFPELADAVRWAGSWLLARRVQAGDVVTTYAPDSIVFTAMRHTGSWIGEFVVTLSPHQETAGQLCRPGACWLVTTSQLLVRKLLPRMLGRTEELATLMAVTTTAADHDRGQGPYSHTR
jgi:hypothetical protein